MLVVLQDKLLFVEIAKRVDHLTAEDERSAINRLRQEDLIVHGKGHTMGFLDLRSKFPDPRIGRRKGMATAARNCNEIRVDLKWEGKKNVVVRGLDLHVGLEFNDVGGTRIHKPKVVTGGLEDSLCKRYDGQPTELDRSCVECAQDFRPAFVCTPVQNEKEIVETVCVNEKLQEDIVEDRPLIVNWHHNAKGRELLTIDTVNNDLWLLGPRSIRRKFHC
jgi:hypothetical protein